MAHRFAVIQPASKAEDGTGRGDMVERAGAKRHDVFFSFFPPVGAPIAFRSITYCCCATALGVSFFRSLKAVGKMEREKTRRVSLPPSRQSQHAMQASFEMGVILGCSPSAAVNDVDAIRKPVWRVYM